MADRARVLGRTAIRRGNASAPARWLAENGLICGTSLDYGCGHGKDADTFGMERWDPCWWPSHVPGRRGRKYDTVLCTYVLCVISNKEQQRVLAEIKRVLHPKGIAYLTVRRDRKDMARHHRMVRLNLPLVVEVPGRFAIYRMVKRDDV